jgi:MerR family transcriptional regulator, light-induced transcriptional regulator
MFNAVLNYYPSTMNTMSNISQADQQLSSLTIGELAEACGIAPATLRMWEQRHGFPVPRRLRSGHRRYDERDVALVRQVLAQRDAGVRLERAIDQVRSEVTAEAGGGSKSVFAELRKRHPHLQPQALKKSTLLALSWAIEDEFCAKAERPRLFGSFQRTRYFEHAAPRWRELARVARATIVYADFDETRTDGRIVKVGLEETDPMAREWSVICDAPGLSAALTAWELPGQEQVPDRHRVFESIWTVDPRAVRDAARTSVEVAHGRGAAEAAPLLYELADSPPLTVADLEAVSTMFTRVVAYVDRYGQ